MASPFLRVAFRRHLEALRIRRLPQQPPARRHRSSGPTPETKKAEVVEDPIPVPNTVAPLPFWERLGPLTKAGQAYARAQRRRPWATQVASSLVIYFCADISAQRMSGNEYDPKRTARSLVIGGVSAIPNYTWFMWLSRHFNYPSHALSIAAKVAVNQICMTPVFNTYFFGAQALLSGYTPAETWERVRRTVPVSFVNSAKLWPAVTAFSFTYVPVEHRSVFAGVVAVGWQTYLSFLNRQAEAREEGEKREKKKKKKLAAAAGEQGSVNATTTSTTPGIVDVDVESQDRRVPA